RLVPRRGSRRPVALLARCFQRCRSQQAADMIRAERRLCSLHRFLRISVVTHVSQQGRGVVVWRLHRGGGKRAMSDIATPGLTFLTDLSAKVGPPVDVRTAPP